MRYYVNMDRLKEDGEELIHYAQNNIGTKYNEMERLLDDFEWEGEARNIFDDNYKKMIKKIEKLENIVFKLGTFMVTCSEHYNESEQEIIRKWQEDLLKYKEVEENIN